MRVLVGKIRRRLGPLWWNSGLFFVASRAGDLLNMYIGLIIVPDVIPQDDLGAVLPLLGLIPFLALPLSIVMRTGLKFVSTFEQSGQHGRAKRLIRDLLFLTVVVSVFMAVGIICFGDHVLSSLKIGDGRVMSLIACAALASCWLPLVTVVCQATKAFHLITLTRIVGPLARLVTVLLLIERYRLFGFLAGSVAVLLGQVLVMLPALISYGKDGQMTKSYRDSLGSMLRYVLPTAILVVCTGLQVFVFPWAVRAALPKAVSAGYYLAAQFGNIPAWVAPAMVPFLFPLVAEMNAKGQSTRRLHLQSLGVIAVVGLTATLLLGVGAGALFQLRESWHEYQAFSGYAWWQSVIATLTVMVATHGMHETACFRFRFLFFLFPAVVTESVLLGVIVASTRSSASCAGITHAATASAAWLTSLPAIMGVVTLARAISFSGIVFDLTRGRARQQGARDGR